MEDVLVGIHSSPDSERLEICLLRRRPHFGVLDMSGTIPVLTRAHSLFAVSRISNESRIQRCGAPSVLRLGQKEDGAEQADDVKRQRPDE